LKEHNLTGEKKKHRSHAIIKLFISLLNFLIYKVKIQHSLLGAGLERYTCHLCRFFQHYMWIFTMLPPYYLLFNVDIYNRELWYLTSLSTIFMLYHGGQFIFGGGNRSTQGKPSTYRKSPKNVITKCWTEYTSPEWDSNSQR
jgi:hypothetical protein